VHWQPALHFQLGIRGTRVTAVNLPQVQAAVRPDLTVRGDSKRIDIAGSVHTDRLRILGTDFGGPQPSSDVVYVKNAKKPSVGPALSADIRVSLGHDAKVLIGGLRAGLAGDLQVRMENGGPPSMDGTLRMVDGHYDIYGNSLTFERGAILFRGPPNAATLDVLAVRTIKNSNSFAVDNRPIQAGVEVNGTLTHPQVSLYSDPSMAQSDILSYLVLGTPSTGLQSQNALLSAAAGQLFSAGSSALFGNHGNGGPGGFDFGVTSNGSNTLSGAMVTLGRYITPDLYLSVGQSIIGPGTVARLRSRLTRNIELQTESGTQNGANIFYRIDF
jgi:translocation and assembly module TamB